MNKTARIVLISLSALAVAAAALILVWVFPLRDKWRGELRAGFASPEEEERYVCDLTYTFRSSDGGARAETYKVISNAPGAGVWRYVANAASGCYMAGDTCYVYDGDPLAGGELVRAGETDAPPQPAYRDYFSFLFGEGGAFAEQAKGINKFPWGGGTYTFSLPASWFIGEEFSCYGIIDNTHYTYKDVKFEVAGRDRVTRLRFSYSYHVNAHYVSSPTPTGGWHDQYVESYSGSVEADAVFSYPEGDTPIETDAQFGLVQELNAARADKAAARYTDTYLRPVSAGDPAAGYLFPAGEQVGAVRGSAKCFPEEDIFVACYGSKADVYRASTLEKLCTLDHLLNIEDIDADGGRLLVALTDGTSEDVPGSLPWEKNLCFLVYDLADFSVLCRYKAEGLAADSGGSHPCCLVGGLIVYKSRGGGLVLHDIASGETRETGRSVYGELYADRENGRILYEEDLQEYRAYDLATGTVSVYDRQPPVYALHIGEYTLDTDGRGGIAVTDAGGEAVHTFDGRASGFEVGSFAVPMEGGRYFCGLYGCLFVFDPAGVR